MLYCIKLYEFKIVMINSEKYANSLVYFGADKKKKNSEKYK